MRVRLLLAAGALLASACGAPPAPRAPRAEPLEALRPTEEEVRRVAQQFETLETGFLEWYYEAHPVRATSLGVHGWDGELPPQDRQAIQRRIDDTLIRYRVSVLPIATANPDVRAESVVVRVLAPVAVSPSLSRALAR